MVDARVLALVLLCCIVGSGTTAGAVVDGSVSAEAEVGVQLTAFMQVTSAEAGGTVDAGVWKAGVGDEPAGDKMAGLAAELERVEAERDAIVAAREAGEIDDVEYAARMSGVVGRLLALETAIDRTADESENREAVDRLRTAAADAAGTEVRDVARSMPGGEPPGLANAERARGDRDANTSADSAIDHLDVSDERASRPPDPDPSASGGAPSNTGAPDTSNRGAGVPDSVPGTSKGIDDAEGDERTGASVDRTPSPSGNDETGGEERDREQGGSDRGPPGDDRRVPS